MGKTIYLSATEIKALETMLQYVKTYHSLPDNVFTVLQHIEAKLQPKISPDDPDIEWFVPDPEREEMKRKLKNGDFSFPSNKPGAD